MEYSITFKKASTANQNAAQAANNNGEYHCVFRKASAVQSSTAAHSATAYSTTHSATETAKTAGNTRTYTLPGGTCNGLFCDALDQPHLLVAGTTGSGKSVFLDGMVHAIMHRAPLNIAGGAYAVFIDPKGTEFAKYERLPHTLAYEYREDKYLEILEIMVDKMQQRFDENRQRGIRTYDRSDIYLFIDEWADIKNVCGNKAVTLLQRLCQKGRAARIHVVLATQHPSAKVLPEEVRGNFDSRVALQTASWKNSRIILDDNGAENLHPGVCIYSTPKRCLAGKKMERVAVPYVKDDELLRLVDFWRMQTT